MGKGKKSSEIGNNRPHFPKLFSELHFQLRHANQTPTKVPLL